MAAVYAVMISLMVVQKPLFMLVEDAYRGVGIVDVLRVIRHGAAMDFSMAGYLSVIPFLLIIASVWTDRKWVSLTAKVYFAVVSFIMAGVAVVDASLYPYWGFRLDMTPVFYFLSSPGSAMASMAWYGWTGAVLLTAVVAAAFYLVLTKVFFWRRLHNRVISRRILSTVVLSLLTAAMIIPIRGGVTVSTMNLSRSYFSNDMRLNHAAINPLFSLLYSASHQSDFSSQFRFMDDDEASRIFAGMQQSDEISSSEPMIAGNPDIYLIILESFSAHLMPSLGGEPIALSLDSIARQGWLFTDFYASSFRTDRALPAILCGYPAQPSTSILKYVDKLDDLPSIPRSLKKKGYDMTYYYGGDINFTNVNAMLVAAGFDRIISDKDFPVGQRLSKWGVHDDKVFARVMADMEYDDMEKPRLRVIQTSSSHEPFDVPYDADVNRRVNAFMYADHCLGQFISYLKASGRWSNSLVLIVPDHWGGYPEDLTSPQERHHIPLVMAGGVLDGVEIDRSKLSVPASQTDIASTLLSMLGIGHGDFTFSHDIFAAGSPCFAFFSEPSWIAVKTPESLVVISTDTGRLIDGDDLESERRAKAFLQKLYDDLDSR